MKIKIPFKTPSVNHLYYHMRNMKVKTKEARELEKQIIEICEKKKHKFTQDKRLKVSVWIHENWYFKNGKPCTKDIANREKFLIDAIFKGLKLDDKMIFENTMTKVDNSMEEFALVKIEELPYEI